ncbi:MAG: hypothetical protein DME04_25975 [Candidatus Rokuibacteriota bacterium]|nr:MAG: hypothetical protein DME04_25975 [Candidatus Rokubacteria bacterium]
MAHSSGWCSARPASRPGRRPPEQRAMAKGINNPVEAHEVEPVSVSELIHQHLLALELCGGESFAAWKGCLDDLVARGLRAPLLAVIDGNAGLWRSTSCGTSSGKLRSTRSLRSATTSTAANTSSRSGSVNGEAARGPAQLSTGRQYGLVRTSTGCATASAPKRQAVHQSSRTRSPR